MNTTMTAANTERYGPPSVITLISRERPAPKTGEGLVRVHAAAVTAADARFRSGNFPPGFAIPGKIALGIRGPRRKRPGMVFAGSVESLGDEVTSLAVADRVVGMTGIRQGAHAEYVTVPASVVTRVPDAVTSADAAATLFGGTAALYFLRDRAKLQAGQSVLINGASGSVGSAAVQLARTMGADVTAVCSAANADLARQLGAERVIDYGQTPVSALREQFDVVLDAVGNIDRALGQRLTQPGGNLLLAVANLGDTVAARGNVHAGSAPERPDDFAFLLELVADGSFDPLTEVVGGLEALPEAHARIDSGRKVGNLVVTPNKDAKQ